MAQVATKRQNPYSDYGHHRNQKVLKQDMDTISAKTLAYLMNNARQEGVWGFKEELRPTDDRDLTPCFVCTQKMRTGYCNNCSNSICEPCARQCESCRNVVCSFCSVKNYDHHTCERVFCLNCNDSIEEEKRRLRRSSPFPSPQHADNPFMVRSRLTQSFESVPKPNFDVDAMDVDD